MKIAHDSPVVHQKDSAEKRPASHYPQDRKTPCTALSGLPIAEQYTQEDLRDWDPERDLGHPGDFPYTRGIHQTMYRSRLWTMRQFAGFGTAHDTNARFKYLLDQGQTGLSVAFDMPTLMGLDSDDPQALGEVGYCGVAISSLEDMATLFDGIPLNRVSVSMTINGPAAVIFAMYLTLAERQGIPLTRLNGTLQNDILKEYIAQKEWLFPPAPHMRLITDTIGYCSEHVPKWHPISISGYHIREAGSTAVQELAFTLYNGLTYVEAAVQAGLPIDAFAPQLSFFFNSHNDFFEEIAKFRAARRVWAQEMKDRYHPNNPRSFQLRFHAQTAGCSLMAQQPMNNVVRTTLQALAAVLGGTQSLHTNSMDETLSLPTQEAVTLALRTQQIIAHESGVTNTVDPLAGSYFIEHLTNRMEEGAREYFRKLDAMGGMLAAIERGFPQREILEASQHYQEEIERKERIIVGVNEYVESEQYTIPTLRIGKEVEQYQRERLRSFRANRDPKKVAEALHEIQWFAQSGENLLPHLMHAVKARATLGEICGALKGVFGTYREPVVL
ncbi:acyl-CoA mutase large subunit family protein [Candidatus Nitrospira neomarina]|uniref:Methylmalonyl-CoA mutase family protein n=1 Tax=Candidatus Nitrospira neomarina TaxID=3020899 RepID=A0AA96GMH3_9BACT|nr:methylmalonyl-CoA mutase family protein [Candidatus Nitrospira neomarina]WNM63050.1 methylmalonyl-CoA mutase family protein [Candidatus Nitrospira neomarina]